MSQYSHTTARITNSPFTLLMLCVLKSTPKDKYLILCQKSAERKSSKKILCLFRFVGDAWPKDLSRGLASNKPLH